MPDRSASSVSVQRKLVVSLHDVSPHTWEPCRQILGELKRAGVSRASLLVIPDRHQRGNFLQHSAFCGWLKREVTAGSEAVLHGYHHRRTSRAGESWPQRWITRTYTAREG